MLQRAIKSLVGLAVPIQRYPLMQKVQFGFFFQNKEQEKMKAQIEQIKDEISEVEDEDQMIAGYHKIIELREEMESKKDKICIEMLLDKAQLARLYFSINEENEIIDELTEEDHLSKISFHNIPLYKYPYQYKDYLINQYLGIMLPIKILNKFYESEPEVLLEWAKQYLQSINFLKEYQEKNFNFLQEEEGFIEKKQIEVNYKYYRIIHDELVGRIYIAMGQYQEAISILEGGLQLLDNVMLSVNQMHDHENPDIVDEAKDLKERLNSCYGEIFEQLASISIILQDNENAKPYLQQACDIFLQCFGKFSDRYINTYCTLALADKDIKTTEQMLEELYEQVQSSHKTPIITLVGMYYFCILESLGKANDKLYEDIELYRDEEDLAATPQLQIDYSVHAVSYCLQKKWIEACCDHFDEVLDLIEDIQDESVITRYLQLIDLAYQLPKNSIKKLNYLNQLYSQLKDISTEQKQIQFHLDYQVSILQFKLRHSLKLDDEEALVRFNEFIENYEDNVYQPIQIERIYEMAQIVYDEKMVILSYEIYKKGLKIIKKQEIKGNYQKLYMEAIMGIQLEVLKK